MTETEPLLVSVKDAAARLGGITPWSVYRLLDAGEIEGRYQGRRRYVVTASLAEYVDRLPTQPESA